MNIFTQDHDWSDEQPEPELTEETMIEELEQEEPILENERED